MPTVTMPQLGESVAEGTIGKWLKQVGDSVELGEPIVEVVTDKVNAEVPSPFAGTLTQILVGEGQTVPNDADIAVIEAAGSGAASGDRSRAGAARRTCRASARADTCSGADSPRHLPRPQRPYPSPSRLPHAASDGRGHRRVPGTHDARRPTARA